MPRKPSNAPCSEDGCDRKATTQGLCKRHYDQKRHQGRIERVSNAGRPKKVTPKIEGQWWGDEPVSASELRSLLKRQMKAMLEDGETSKDLRVSIARIMKDWNEEEQSDEDMKKLEELRGKVIGLAG